jgi:dipeptidyl aminopeptidase/acylaminoacyl peptidase
MNGHQVSGEPFSVTHATSYRYAQAKWFPDSKRFIYTNWPTGQRPQIWQAKLDGSQTSPINPDGVSQYFGGTLADGQSVLFLDEDANATLRIRRASLADGSVRTLAESTGSLGHVNFSRDGSAAVYHDNAVMQHVWKIDFKSGVKTQLTPDGVSAGFPHFTPDAKWISVQILKPGATEIGLIPASGGTPEILWNETGRWFNGGWAADGETLLFAGNRGSGWALYSLSRRTRQVERLTKDLPAGCTCAIRSGRPTGNTLPTSSMNRRAMCSRRAAVTARNSRATGTR